MNKTKRLGGKVGFVLCAALLGAGTTYGQPSVSVGVSVPLPSVQVEIRTESDFYEPLAPQGEWVVIGSYGRCWRPARVEAGWRPYCNGYWQRCDAGWYWVSDEPWAWATYHYGRWDFTDHYGWYWVPQTQWAPAWVSWHEGGGYIGWAPLQPSVRISASGFVGFNATVISPRAFVFVEQRRFLEPIRPATVVVNNITIINKTTVITNTRLVNNAVINEGPATTAIEKASGRKIEAVPVRELRHKQEAAVVTRQAAPASASEKQILPPVPSAVKPLEKKTVAATAAAPPQIQQPARVTHESAAPAPKINEAQSEKHKPVAVTAEAKPPQAVPAVKPEVRREGSHPATNIQPTVPKADKQAVKQQKPAKGSDKKAQPPAKEQPVASEKNQANPVEKDHENRPKE